MSDKRDKKGWYVILQSVKRQGLPIVMSIPSKTMNGKALLTLCGTETTIGGIPFKRL